VELVAELPVPVSGYLGLVMVPTSADSQSADVPDVAELARRLQSLPEDPDQTAGGSTEPGADVAPANAGIRLQVVRDSPAAAAGLPPVVTAVTLNGQPLPSARAFRQAMQEISPGRKVTLAYQVPDSGDPLNLEFEAGSFPDTVPELSDEFLTAFGGKSAAGDASNFQRREFPLDEQGKAIVLGNETPGDARPGVVIHLSGHSVSEAEILKDWQAAMASHRLLVVIPANPENGPLVADDIPLILAALQLTGQTFKADLSRVVLIADRVSASLAWDLATSGPTPVRGIALTSGSFPAHRLGGSQADGLDILLPIAAGDAQVAALLQQNRLALEKSACRVSLQREGPSIRSIADWTILLRAL
jgi:hypothetical protein